MITIKSAVNIFVMYVLTFSGGFITILITEKYLGIGQFNEDVIEPMYRAEDQGLLKIVERQIIPNAINKKNGIFFILKVL